MKALIAALTAALGVVIGLTVVAPAQAATTGTLYGGKGNYTYINQRSQPSTSSDAAGYAHVGDDISMTCRTTGTPVENNSRWIYSGSYYIADAFVTENTDKLPSCGGTTGPGTTPTAPATPTAGQKTVGIDMVKQVQNQWCWDASGLTIAKFWGFTGYDQNDFCRLAASGRWLDCNNQPATLEDMANGLAKMGIASSGDSVRRPSFSQVAQQIDAGRPFGVRFGWHSGGGHMNVIYGYDGGSNMIAVGDPWPTTQTYTWWDYDNYANNSRFEWTHSRINIHN
ncbi:papain-like cysteine protease family protein [Streptomyces sp. NBRC 110611]|uniref:papain-like cysteine protease family protein n=1 Tax=Streptomyces sp. NBRC 110611 TaxID=1621259 RepID=UPI00215BF90F|nr:papain-like cysteine protease family protein [Streptomyces sp. NBRC 110611]